MRRLALFSVLALPFMFAALPAISLFGGGHPATGDHPLVVVNGDAATTNVQSFDSASLGPVTEPVAYGVPSPAPVDCHASPTTTIEG